MQSSASRPRYTYTRTHTLARTRTQTTWHFMDGKQTELERNCLERDIGVSLMEDVTKSFTVVSREHR